MKSVFRKTIIAGALAAALGAGTAHAMVPMDAIGSTVSSGGPVDRVISVDSSTRWVNVRYGETVRIVVNNAGSAQSFVFRFNGHAISASLGDIAPKLTAGANLPVYIDQNGNPLLTWVY